MPPQEDHAFLTVISWPKTAEINTVVARIAEASGLDEPSLRLKARQPAPAILGMYPAEAVQWAVHVLIDSGGDAFGPTLADIEAVGPTCKVKDLSVTERGISVEPWRGDPCVIDPRTIDVVIRARVSEVATLPEAPTSFLSRPISGTSLIAMQGWGFGGSYGMATGVYGSWFEHNEDFLDSHAPEKSFSISHKLDLHARRDEQSPVVYQIDGDKFGFQILGDLRGQSDNVNIDRMCELMTHLNPQIVVDPYFRLFKPPAGCTRLRLPMMHANQDDPAFAFYSRWAALMYRHVMQG